MPMIYVLTVQYKEYQDICDIETDDSSRKEYK